jgi:AcrR family transcriptional regulator
MVHLVQVRADARRNRSRILAAARALVAESGPEVTMEDIARRAGVAVGTLYRHFPAKEDLVAAVVEDSVAQVADLAGAALDAVHAGAAAGERLAALFRVIAERHATDRAFKAAAGELDPAAGPVAGATAATARAVAAITAILDRARAEGAVRDDVTLADLVVLLDGVPGHQVADEQRRRYVDIVLAGVRPPGSDHPDAT